MLKTLTDFLLDTWQKATRTFRLFFSYLMSQMGIQAMNFVTGLLILRSMAKEEYAAYTIMNTLVPVMLMLSDTGITTGLMAIGRLWWEDDDKMGRLVATGTMLRRKFALVSVIVVTPILAWMLYRNHVAPLEILFLMIASLAGISSQLTGGVMKSVLQIRQQFGSLMQMGLASTFLRLALMVMIVLLFKLNAFLAIAATTVSVMLEAYMAVRVTKPQIVWEAPVDPEYQKTIFSLVKKTLPLTIYFSLQSQISIWLISVLGSSHQVADLGAAGRLAIIFTTVTAAFSTIMVTKFARNNGRKRLFVQFLQIVLGLVGMLLAVTITAWIWPTPFIWLLGPKYVNMSGLIWLVILSAGGNQMAGSIFGLNTCKGWIPPAIITIPIEIATQISLISTMNLSSLENVLIFSGLSAIPPTVVNTVFLLRRIHLEPE